MDLVLGRAVQHMFDQRPEREPYVAVTQVRRQTVEDEHHVGHAEQRVTADFPATGVPNDAGIEADDDCGREFFQDLFHEMHPAGGGGYEDTRRMMDFVESPEPSGVKGAMGPVIDEILQQEYAQAVEQ